MERLSILTQEYFVKVLYFCVVILYNLPNASLGQLVLRDAEAGDACYAILSKSQRLKGRIKLLFLLFMIYRMHKAKQAQCAYSEA